MENKRILITGGAGFIGSALIREIINNTNHRVLNFDKLTYAGNLESLAPVSDNERYNFVQGDIANQTDVHAAITEFKPDIVMNLAAESHVDRSIDGPAEFIQTNIVGTFILLNECKNYWENLEQKSKSTFRFHHISTDEVFGSLGENDLFVETTPYQPNSPYSSSKASSDHLVRAWHKTYGLPTIQTNCSNNYGPYHFPEKLVPLIILNALDGKPLPVYGDGSQIRDWLYVEDHARALLKVVLEGRIGETYNIGGHNEKKNIEVVKTICDLLDELKPVNAPNITKLNISKYSELITYVTDRPGHDTRYAIDASKIQRELGWKPEETFESGLRKTVEWYLKNLKWCEVVTKNKQARERRGN